MLAWPESSAHHWPLHEIGALALLLHHRLLHHQVVLLLFNSAHALLQTGTAMSGAGPSPYIQTQETRSMVPQRAPRRCDHWASGKKTALQLFSVASTGQYGHLKERTGLFAIFWRDCLHRTCPQGSSIGGFSGVLCSRDTGQAKTEWKTNSLPSSSSCRWGQFSERRQQRQAILHCLFHEET